MPEQGSCDQACGLTEKEKFREEVSLAKGRGQKHTCGNLQFVRFGEGVPQL